MNFHRNIKSKENRAVPKNGAVTSDNIRLNKYLAQCGLGSRRKCDTLISEGRIKVNGKPAERGMRVNVSKDKIEYNGKLLIFNKVTFEYIAFHKSKDTVVTANDPQGRTTIYDALLRAGIDAKSLKYVGRLDRNSEGLILLTNDGNLIHSLTHPRFNIKKEYVVRSDTPLSENDFNRMLEGIESEGQILKAGKIRDVSAGQSTSEFWYEIDLYEGKNRQIRRMFEALGKKVIRLKRTQFSVVKLRDLPRGRYRKLQEREVTALKNVGYKSNTDKILKNKKHHAHKK